MAGTGLLCFRFSVFDVFVVAQAPTKYPPTIVFMTDFGVVDDSVAICRGVMYSIMPDVRIVDLTHQVTPFSILDGARFLLEQRPITRRERYLLWWWTQGWGALAKRSLRSRNVASCLCSRITDCLRWWSNGMDLSQRARLRIAIG